jgi:hypothetical protein
MKKVKRGPIRHRFDDEFLDHELDQYSDYFDEEEAIERGWKPSDLGFMMGFRRA